MKKFNLFNILLSVALVGAAGSMNAGNPPEKNDYKYKVSKSVYDRIATTAKDSRKQPTYNFIYNSGKPYFNAYYNPSNNTINLGEGIYDLCAEFGADSMNALAMVLGHELAHFYKDHGWGMAFGTANEDLEVASKIYKLKLTAARKTECEAQADYYGGLFGYMAGYKSLNVGAEFFKKLYTAAKLPNVTNGYPTMDERMKIGDNSKKMLEKLIAVYEAGNMLCVTDDFERAASCYDHIISVFPSREIYNNAGVALAREALKLYDVEKMKFAYPFTLDLDTRMDNAGQKGMTEDKEEKIKRLLNEAKEMFQTATNMDKEYAPAYLNLAMVSDLLGDHELAVGMAGKAVQMAEASGEAVVAANAHIAKGIALANTNKTADAKSEFNKGKDGNKAMAELNLNAVSTPGFFAKLFGQPKATTEKSSTIEENIGEIEPSLIDAALEGAEELEIKRQNEKRPSMKIYSRHEGDYTAIKVKTYSYPKGLDNFVVTTPWYRGKSGRGITIGAKASSVKDVYGAPARTVAGAQGTFLVYEKSKIIFLVDANDKVSGWVLYAKEN
ncbi:MAG: tetratricopeptide repeat domain protein [Bacteroidetes bacterium]|jgi:tetratricopeptide (TPR) repeat protein|nr:tetratricopeptide repeat domain protein [Bacteroidota bacterium]